MNYNLINNNQDSTMYRELSRELQSCNSFIFNVAFINFGGLQLLLDDLQKAETRGIKGKILTSTYLNFTDPKALQRLKSFKNIETRIFVARKNLGFHSKCYIFEYDDYYKIYIGSSNITQSALKSNIEWNVRIESKKDNSFVAKIFHEFNKLWKNENIAENSEDFIGEYESHLLGFTSKFASNKTGVGVFKFEKNIKPNYMQELAIDNLKRIRNHGDKKALVIASTGSGKTYMSAFDVREKNPQSLLFLVHREDILKQAILTFKNVLPPYLASEIGEFTGGNKEFHKKYIFSTLQTMNNHFEKFGKDEFKYIIVDEAHHATSPSYTKLLNYFTPEFLLGMTATPERSDGESVYDIFGNNIALDLRLREALEHELVVPFHYYGITDIEDVDFSGIALNNTHEVAKILNINKRVEFILEKMNFYGYDGDKMKALGFCVSVDHANFMCESFNKFENIAAVLTGSDAPSVRSEVIARLEDESDPLKIIFTVDIFNEGIDIPSINLVLMLRPTASPVIFIQQLGRGLRKDPSKEFLTVLDFIGNHNRGFLIALALTGNKFYDKDSLKISIENDFSDIPGCVHIKMDEISKDRILNQIENENFNAMKYLKEEYLEFKLLNKNRIPMMCDYLKFDGAPNPLKFIKSNKTYLGFLQKVDTTLTNNLESFNEKGLWALKNISDFLPLKRVHEFVLLKLLIEKESITKKEFEYELAKYLKSTNEKSVIHSIRMLQWDFLSEKEKINSSSKPFPILSYNSERDEIVRAKEFSDILENSFFNEYIKDTVIYGINRYEEEFGAEDYGIPHFKLYETYTQFHTALLSNYEKSLSAFRGSGVLKNGEDYFLFVTLEKPKDIKESINYKNSFFNAKELQWQTQNMTAQDSERGLELTQNIKYNKNLHIFVRKFTEVDKVIQPFIYLGRADCKSYEGEKPITLRLELREELPLKIYKEFV